jgi:hypothetical protein
MMKNKIKNAIKAQDQKIENLPKRTMTKQIDRCNQCPEFRAFPINLAEGEFAFIGCNANLIPGRGPYFQMYKKDQAGLVSMIMFNQCSLYPIVESDKKIEEEVKN